MFKLIRGLTSAYTDLTADDGDEDGGKMRCLVVCECVASNII
jgi:hypothetical protein